VRADPPVLRPGDVEEHLVSRVREPADPAVAAVGDVTQVPGAPDVVPHEVGAVVGAQPPVVVPREVEQHLVPGGPGEVADPDRAPIRDVPEPGRVADVVPHEVVAVVGAEPPVAVAGEVEEHLGPRGAGEVADPDRAPIRDVPEPRRVADVVPHEVVAVVGPQPPIAVAGRVEEHLGPRGAGEVADPERSAVVDVAEAGRDADIVPDEVTAAAAVGAKPPSAIGGRIEEDLVAAGSREAPGPDRTAIRQVPEPHRVAHVVPSKIVAVVGAEPPVPLTS
jgi:hypothetical protein